MRIIPFHHTSPNELDTVLGLIEKHSSPRLRCRLFRHAVRLLVSIAGLHVFTYIPYLLGKVSSTMYHLDIGSQLYIDMYAIRTSLIRMSLA